MSGKFSSQRNNSTNRRGNSTNQRDLDGGIRFGKKSSSNYDAVATVQTVATKPLKKMTARDWRIFRENYNISTKGGKSPPPLRSFRENPIGVTPIHPSIIDAIENNLRYKEPSPIQRIAIPIGMQRRDLIGIAETGSGKTAAFGIPLCHHVLCFPKSILDSVADDGPLALVMAPTRELALQINVEFGKLLSGQRNVNSLAVVGGQSITEQATKLRNGVHIIVGTPGRINDCVEMAYLVLNQCSYIVLDEADRMIDLGFAPQIEQILDAMGGKLKSENEEEAYEQERRDLEALGKAVPSHRLTAMFSATMPSEVERIAKRYLRHPVIVSVGDQDSGKNARITQRILYLSSPKQKEGTLRDILRRSRPNEKIIVFVNEKKHSEGVGRMVESSGRRCVVLHGGKTQEEREKNLAIFRQGGVVMVATDVAGRGLDIPDVQQVINFDLPTRSIDNYCHRIGRTGRAGKEGLATSFITDEDEGIMAPLTQYLKSTGSNIPDRLARHPAATSSIHGDYIR
ncbi:ATP-dependent RNA helicase [Skeletonema marinoi]|uniref:RNA helicase n=1 Tax=Skeletonema marinoi TaxID=267567 RepID=A0AAD8YDD4_9STRA|nr:ATP-dependent RNA helicase [Skeletonema marinoi]